MADYHHGVRVIEINDGIRHGPGTARAAPSLP